MVVTTCPSEQQLQAFQLGDLPDDVLEELAQHLERCVQCEVRAQRLDAKTDSLLAAIREVSPLGMPAAANMAQPSAVTPAGAHSVVFQPAQLPDEIGRLGNYRVLRQLGHGGMSFVFLAEDVTLRRPVALKVMKPELAADHDGTQRFLREARIMAAIKHPHLVTVYQTEQVGKVVYLAMELLQGESLGAWMKRRGAAAPADVIRLGQEIASGLAVVHRHGLVHRDVKPDNVWLEAPGGGVKILDFGLARFIHEDAKLTRTGTIMGTPAYMSPEQARGLTVDARSDLFSLGCILYSLCTGNVPFSGDSAMAILTALATTQPQPVHEVNPAMPRALSDLVMQLLAKKPELRPPSAEAVLERLRWIESGPSLPPARVSRRRRVVGLAAAVLVCLIGAGVLLGGRERARPVPSVATPFVVAENGPPTFLSDLDESERVNWPFLGRLPVRPGDPATDRPNKSGRAVFVQGQHSPHGIFMHLPRENDGTPVSISYHLNKQYARFVSDISLNDGPAKCIPLTFTVHGDGKLLWQSQELTSQDDRQTCSISVAGVQVLQLQLSGDGDERGTHAVWIEPHLTK